jgi:hypothetical protein
LSKDKRFKKYQWIDVRVTKASDARPESYHPELSSIQISSTVPSEDKWRRRREIIAPLMSRSLCALKRERDTPKPPTLGIFRPKSIRALVIEPDSEQWDAGQLAMLRQIDLFENAPVSELEKIPFNFKYEFDCDDDDCTGHSLICTDWEMGAAYRGWRAQYGRGWEEKFRLKFEREMIELNDTHFYVGTLHSHPNIWIIVGLFYPRR